ncbi:trypsin-like serine peptidase, partial [Tardiphaga sp. P5_C10]
MESRKDIVSTTSQALSTQLEKIITRKDSSFVPPASRARRSARARSDKRFEMRKELLEAPRSDPNAFERMIGESDLLSINFLDRGRRAADAVCRIKVPSNGGAWYGTGFLVGPRLLLTNHHVLGDADEASQC